MLIVSYIGYNTQDVTVTSKTVYNIQLEEDSQALDEVVVVGYGTQKKVNLTGSVASVSSDEIKDRVQTDVLSSIHERFLALLSYLAQGKMCLLIFVVVVTWEHRNLFM